MNIGDKDFADKSTGVSVSIVFLNFNRLKETRITAEKLLGCRDELDGMEIIAVDNGSTDGTGEYLTGLNDKIKTVLLDSNYGIEGYNRGFKIAQGDVIIVLDDDSHVESDTIKQVKKLFLEEHNLGILAFNRV
jgi:GT2 family glycosyltransferase